MLSDQCSPHILGGQDTAAQRDTGSAGIALSTLGCPMTLLMGLLFSLVHIHRWTHTHTDVCMNTHELTSINTLFALITRSFLTGTHVCTHKEKNQVHVRGVKYTFILIRLHSKRTRL